jgi:hypothetical protein
MPPCDLQNVNRGILRRHAAEFCENTFAVDVSALYIPFLREIPEHGAILMQAADLVGMLGGS